jgi:hypothetical protein
MGCRDESWRILMTQQQSTLIEPCNGRLATRLAAVEQYPIQTAEIRLIKDEATVTLEEKLEELILRYYIIKLSRNGFWLIKGH